MRSAHTNSIVSGTGQSPLDAQVEQLWRVPVATGQVRIVVDPKPDPAWSEVESYWILPSVSRARLLVPDAAPQVTASSLLSYRALRQGRVNTARGLLGLLARAGLAPGRHRLSVQRRNPAGRIDAVADLPLENVAAALLHQGQPDADGTAAVPRRLYAAIGIRQGDNRKPTLQLFDVDGRPAGYAKLAWDAGSSDCIIAEANALSSLGGLSETVRVPALLATGTYAGFPYLVTQPLPLEARGVRGSVAPPSPAEMYTLCPVSRTGTLCSTAHFQALEVRLAQLTPGIGTEVHTAVGLLMAELRRRNPTVPVTERWHGDLVPWNTARDGQGRLWIWDWELCEPDAMAGLDAVHWAFSVRRERGAGSAAENLVTALDDAAVNLDAAGLPRAARADVAALYAVVVAERAMTLAARNGSWEASWITSQQVVDMITVASGNIQRTEASTVP